MLLPHHIVVFILLYSLMFSNCQCQCWFSVRNRWWEPEDDSRYDLDDHLEICNPGY